MRAATGVLGEDRDRAAGERMLSDVRRSLETLQQVDGPQGALLRAALDLSGVTSDPGIAKLAEAAEAARRDGGPVVRVNEPAPPAGGGRADEQQGVGLGGLLGQVLRPSVARGETLRTSPTHLMVTPPRRQVLVASLEAKLFELRAAVGVALVGSVDALLLLLDGKLGGGGS